MPKNNKNYNNNSSEGNMLTGDSPYTRDISKEIKDVLTSNQSTLKLSKKQIEALHKYEDSLNQQSQATLNKLKKKLLKEAYDYEKQLIAEQKEERIAVITQSWKEWKETKGNDFSKFFSEKVKAVGTEFTNQLAVTAANGVINGLSNIVDSVDSALDTYISKQEAIVAHLNGSTDNFQNVSDKLQTLISTGLVKQSAVYDNVSKFVTQGIVSNVEQKAFLQTLADDIDATFNATDGTLIRLINLQKTDLTSNRLAIEYSLQEFLNQNYETSTYIKESFTSVSQSLIEMQSLMSAQVATETETVIQTYLGAFSSSGMATDTISSLASAINALGSGNTSNLGSGISNLVLMGAARSGLDYADMLVNGLDESKVSTLLEGISDYLAEINTSYSSNVVKSQLAQIYGINVSDLVAATNFEASSVSGQVTSDIYSALLNDFDDLVPGVTRIQNRIDNLIQGMALDIASSDASVYAFKIANAMADTLGDALSGQKFSVKPFGIGIELDLGAIAKAAKVVTILPSLISNLDNLLNVNGSSASWLYDSLANIESAQVSSSGYGLSTIGTTTSNVTNISSSTNTSEFLNNAKNSATGLSSNSITSDEETYDTTDIYKMLELGGISNTGLLLAANAEHNMAVATNTTTIPEAISTIEEATVNIYSLLDQKLTDLSSQLDTVVMAIWENANTVSNAVDNAGNNIGGTFWASI